MIRILEYVVKRAPRSVLGVLAVLLLLVIFLIYEAPRLAWERNSTLVMILCVFLLFAVLVSTHDAKNLWLTKIKNFVVRGCLLIFSMCLFFDLLPTRNAGGLASGASSVSPAPKVPTPPLQAEVKIGVNVAQFKSDMLRFQSDLHDGNWCGPAISNAVGHKSFFTHGGRVYMLNDFVKRCNDVGLKSKLLHDLLERPLSNFNSDTDAKLASELLRLANQIKV